MGFFDFITEPVHRILTTIERPIEEVKRIFGDVIEFTEEVIKGLVDMIKQIEHLFDQGIFESLFVEPFKAAIAHAISSIEKLLAIIADAGKPVVGEMKTVLEEPIMAAYDTMKEATEDMLGKLHNLIKTYRAKSLAFNGALHRELTIIKSMSQTMRQDVDDIKSRLKKSIELKTGKTFILPREFAGVSNKSTPSDTHSVTKAGEIKVQDYKSVTASLKKRLENEHAAFDMMAIMTILMILGSLIGLFYITKSFPLMIIVGGILFISLMMTLVT